MAAEEGWVGIAEVADHLQVAKESIYRWVDTKGFPARRVGRLLRFRLSEVDEWVKTGGDETGSTRSRIRKHTQERGQKQGGPR